MKIGIDREAAREVTITFLEDDLKWWESERNWDKEEKKFRKKYLAALKAILKCLK